MVYNCAVIIKPQKKRKLTRGRPSVLDDQAYVAQLKALYGVLPTADIADKLGVCQRSIQYHAKILGLSIKNEIAPTGDTVEA